MNNNKFQPLFLRKWKCFYWTNLRTSTGKAWIARDDIWIRQVSGNLWKTVKKSIGVKNGIH